MGDWDGAVAAYAEAFRAGESPGEPRAVLRHGEALEAGGQVEAAERAFWRASSAAEPDVAAAAWHNLYRYAARRGDVAACEQALEAVIATGDPDEVPRAYRNLGTLLEDERQDVERAHRAYEMAINSGHPLHSKGARVNLGQLLEREGRAPDAAELYRAVAASGHPVEGPRAQFLLGLLLISQGDDADALALFESAMQGGNEEWAARSALEAGQMYLLQLGDPQHAAETLQLAESIPDVEPAQLAAMFGGMAAQQLGRETDAEAAYRRALELLPGQPTGGGCLAAKHLGTMYLQRGELTAAREFLSLAVRSEDPESRARGLLLLGLCEIQAGAPRAAAEAFERAALVPGVPADVEAMARQHLANMA